MCTACKAGKSCRSGLSAVKSDAVGSRLNACAAARLTYLNWMYYSWGSLMVNQFEGSTVLAYGTNQTVLEYFSFDTTSAWAYLGYSAVFFFGFIALAWVGLIFARVHQKR